jgi:hypothetical protein
LFAAIESDELTFLRQVRLVGELLGELLDCTINGTLEGVSDCNEFNVFRRRIFQGVQCRAATATTATNQTYFDGFHNDSP